MPSPKKRDAAEGPTEAPARPGPPWPATAVVLTPIESVREYDRNPRLHSERQVQLIARSFQEFGWTNPLLVSEEGVLIAGHARYLAAKELGLTEVPVMVARGWTDAQVRAYTIADNQMAITGSSFDPTLLALEIEGLRLDGFDLALTGFEPFELDAMSAVPDMTPRDPNALWEGMPEFTHEDQTSLHKVIVHFARTEDLRDFAVAVGQTITEKTRAIWYPAAERGTYADKRWVGEEAPGDEDDLPA